MANKSLTDETKLNPVVGEIFGCSHNRQVTVLSQATTQAGWRHALMVTITLRYWTINGGDVTHDRPSPTFTGMWLTSPATCKYYYQCLWTLGQCGQWSKTSLSRWEMDTAEIFKRTLRWTWTAKCERILRLYSGQGEPTGTNLLPGSRVNFMERDSVTQMQRLYLLTSTRNEQFLNL